MELTGIEPIVTVLAGLAIMLGVVGVVVPVLPGLLLCWAGVLVWTLFGGAGSGRWLVLALATGLALAGTVVKYAWPGRNLRRAGIPDRTLLSGGLLGLVGFFVLPVVGLFVGFVLGVWLAERVRLGDSRLAWPATWHAVRAAGLAMLIELVAAIGIAGVWVAGLILA